MQIELTNQQLQGFEFVQSFRKLAQCTDLGYKANYTVKKLSEKLDKEVKLSMALRQDIVTKYAKKDSDGKVITVQDSPDRADISDENMPLLNKEMAEFMESKVTFEYKKIKLSPKEVEVAKLAPIDLVVLENVLDLPDPDAQPEPESGPGLRAV